MSGLIIVINITVFNQNSGIYIGTDIPLSYNIGYQQRLISNLSVSVQAGMLTKPYDKIIISTIQMFDVNEVLFDAIGEAFSIGYNLQTSLRWHVKRYYFGATYAYFNLLAKEKPIEILEDFYGYNLPFFFPTNASLQSKLHNTGLFFGRTFSFKNPRFALDLEFSLLKTFTSNTYFKTTSGEIHTLLTNMLGYRVYDSYREYGYLPSINVRFIYLLY